MLKSFPVVLDDYFAKHSNLVAVVRISELSWQLIRALAESSKYPVQFMGQCLQII